MQQHTEKNTRSAARPLIWLTLAVHLGLGAFLYYATQDNSAEKVETPAAKELTKP